MDVFEFDWLLTVQHVFRSCHLEPVTASRKNLRQSTPYQLDLLPTRSWLLTALDVLAHAARPGKPKACCNGGEECRSCEAHVQWCGSAWHLRAQRRAPATWNDAPAIAEGEDLQLV